MSYHIVRSLLCVRPQCRSSACHGRQLPKQIAQKHQGTSLKTYRDVPKTPNGWGFCKPYQAQQEQKQGQARPAKVSTGRHGVMPPIPHGQVSLRSWLKGHRPIKHDFQSFSPKPSHLSHLHKRSLQIWGHTSKKSWHQCISKPLCTVWSIHCVCLTGVCVRFWVQNRHPRKHDPQSKKQIAL